MRKANRCEKRKTGTMPMQNNIMNIIKTMTSSSDIHHHLVGFNNIQLKIVSDTVNDSNITTNTHRDFIVFCISIILL